ncbi:MAG: histidine kinase [Proteobacteria bacterium]|nr:MAG: histidine kinase [Pseudomonadota bacterium]
MAGIGFELRRLLADERKFGVFRAYAYAGLISSGPWILSILGVMAIGVVTRMLGAPDGEVIDFLVSITYLVACSLILSGGLQLMYTRFTADRLFEKRRDKILPNLLGSLLLISVLAAIIAGASLYYLFHESMMYEVLMFTGFVILCNLWIVVVFLNGMKEYRAILWAFFVGYGSSLIISLVLMDYGTNGLLFGFVSGQALLVFMLLWLIIRDYPSRKLLEFEFLNRKKCFYSLAVTGILLNMGIWADKFIFWFNPVTSEAVIGPLRASFIYDFPIFLAYLSIIPGMAVFLVRMETDFVEQYDYFYNAVRSGSTLEKIMYYRDGMVLTVRQGIAEIFKVQGMTILLAMLFGPALLKMFGISLLYIPLLNIDLIGVALQVLFMALINVLFYLDKRIMAAWLCGLFFVGNVLLTLLSQWLGPLFYGYGFALALLLACTCAVLAISRCFERLEYETFMLKN